MKKIFILFFFLLLIVGVGKGHAQTTSSKEEIEQIKKLIGNKKESEEFGNAKILGVLTGKSIQISDSTTIGHRRWFWTVIFTTQHYTRHISYDEQKKEWIEYSKFSYQKDNYLITIAIGIILIALLSTKTYKIIKGTSSPDTWDWIYLTVIIIGIIFFSFFIGTILGLLSIAYIYIFLY